MPGLDSRKAQGMRAKYEARNLEKFGKGNTISGGYKRKKLSEKEKDAAKTAKKVANTARLRKIGKKEKYGSLSEKNAAEMMAARKKPTVKKSGVGTLSDKKTRPVQGRGVGTLNEKRTRPVRGRGVGTLNEKRTRPVQGRGVGTLNDKRTRPTGDAKLNRAKSDNKRGMTKAQSQALGLTGDAGRKAAVKFRADKKTQSDAVAAEAKRKAAEKKKTDRVDTAVTAASIVGGTGLLKVGGRAAVTAAKKAGFNNVKDYKKYLAALSPKNVDSTGRRSPINLKRPNKPSGAKDTRKNQLSKKLSDTVLKTPFLGSRVARRLAQQEKAKEAARLKKIRDNKKDLVKNDRDEMTMKDIGLGTFKKGGLVKKKGIDGIAMRGKTKATRSR